MTTWKQELKKVFLITKDNFKNIKYNTMSKYEFNKEFDNGFCKKEGCPFTIWTKNYVYFPVSYDGSEWIGYAPRNPCNVKTEHL